MNRDTFVRICVAMFCYLLGLFIGTLTGKNEVFRDIANQRCAPMVALIDIADRYHYVCVPKETN